MNNRHQKPETPFIRKRCIELHPSSSISTAVNNLTTTLIVHEIKPLNSKTERMSEWEKERERKKEIVRAMDVYFTKILRKCNLYYGTCS